MAPAIARHAGLPPIDRPTYYARMHPRTKDQTCRTPPAPTREETMRHKIDRTCAPCVAALAAAVAASVVAGSAYADDGPLVLARDGFFYVGGRTTVVDGRPYVSHQMYVEVRIPAKQTHRYPVIMVHGGTMSGTNYTGTPDGREGWAQDFVRQGYAVYVVDQPGRG